MRINHKSRNLLLINSSIILMCRNQNVMARQKSRQVVPRQTQGRCQTHDSLATIVDCLHTYNANNIARISRRTPLKSVRVGYLPCGQGFVPEQNPGAPQKKRGPQKNPMALFRVPKKHFMFTIKSQYTITLDTLNSVHSSIASSFPTTTLSIAT